MLKEVIYATIISICCTHCVGQVEQFVEPVDVNFFDLPSMRDYCIAPDGNEDFFTIQSINGEISQIAFRIKKNGVWSEPMLMPFCDDHVYLEPFLSADGNRLYFASNRPISDTVAIDKDFDIWYVSRAGKMGQWSDPVNIGAPVNTLLDEFYPCITANNNLYFTKDAPGGMGKDDIYRSVWNGISYNAPELCGEQINSAGYEFNAFIAPDESYMIYTRYGTPDGFGSGDLYIALKDSTGNWLPAMNMGAAINSPYMEYCPYVQATSDTLYFTSKRSALVPTKFNGLEDMRNYISGKENGSSRLYKVHYRPE